MKSRALKDETMVPRFLIASLAVFFASTTAFGQAAVQAPPTPPAPAAPAAAPSQLDQILNFWEQVTHKVTAFEAVCNRTRTSVRFGTTEKYSGTIRILKGDPDLLWASLELHRTDDEKIFEKLLLNDRGLWSYDSTAKVINLHEIPKRVGIFDDTPIALVCGMRAIAAKTRFAIELKGADAFYYYLEILPRFDSDKANIAKIRLTLTKSTYLPRQLWWQQPNQDEVVYDLPRVDGRANHLRPGDFASPQPPPPGWQIALPRPPAGKGP
jgi:TIGR03009 family protein